MLGLDKEDVTVVFVTSVQPKDKKCILLSPSKDNGIKVTSYIRYTKIATLDRKMSLGSIGKVSESGHKVIVKGIEEFFRQ